MSAPTTIRLMFCPECSGTSERVAVTPHEFGNPARFHWIRDSAPRCSGVPVERVYVATDALLSDGAVYACMEVLAETFGASANSTAEDAVQAAIDAATGSTA